MKRAFGVVKIILLVLALGCTGGCGKGKEGEVPAGAADESTAENRGSRESAAREGTGIGVSDIQARMDWLWLLESDEEYSNTVGLQFYQGEAVRFKAIDRTQYTWTEEGGLTALSDPKADIYLEREDGASELLAKDFPYGDSLGNWYMAGDGSIYRFTRNYEEGISLVEKMNREGEILYETKVEMQVADICELADGSIILLLDDGGGINSRLRAGELDRDTGTVAELRQIQMEESDICIGAGEEGLLILDRNSGLREVQTADGGRKERFSFLNTSYQLTHEPQYGTLSDLRILEDGSVEFLWAKGRQCTRESLRIQEFDRIPVIMRGYHFNNKWIKDAVSDFNRENEIYYISLEEAGEDWDDFSTQTSVQMTSGKGPDLLYGEVLSDYVQGMIDKGGFEDLAPYMEDSGIREEDYFPAAFSSWRKGDKIYGINASMNLYSYSAEESLCAGKGEADIETLVRSLLAREEKAMYMRFCGSGDILRMFLEGTEDLWGMIDWETGECDFGGELFAGMLEAAKRYPYDENQDYPILAVKDYCSGVFQFRPSSVLKGAGQAPVGVLFEDGCHMAINSAYQILAVNANSRNKEGAWEFVSYLLGEETQEALAENGNTFPVSREAFRAAVEKDLEMLALEGKIKMGSGYLFRGKYVEEHEEIHDGDITEEWVEELIRAAEGARNLPIRTEPVLEVILEEAEDYFNGVKDREAVVDVIENRVRLYLKENVSG